MHACISTTTNIKDHIINLKFVIKFIPSPIYQPVMFQYEVNLNTSKIIHVLCNNEGWKVKQTLYFKCYYKFETIMIKIKDHGKKITRGFPWIKMFHKYEISKFIKNWTTTVTVLAGILQMKAAFIWPFLSVIYKLAESS